MAALKWWEKAFDEWRGAGIGTLDDLRSCLSRHEPKQVNRFDAFNPGEREILRILLQDHCNSVSEISTKLEGVRVSAYLLAIEELEAEINGHTS